MIASHHTSTAAIAEAISALETDPELAAPQGQTPASAQGDAAVFAQISFILVFLISVQR